MTDGFCEKFNALCTREALSQEGESIGTYNEKRLHKMLKCAVCESTACHEIKVGRFVADVICDGEIYEIQTSGFYPLKKKLDYFLGNTEYGVSIVHPLVASLMLIRVDGETGEVIRKKRSPKKEMPISVLPELYWVSEHIGNERFRIVLPEIEGEEYRFSERMRYRREGAYDAVFLPIGMRGYTVIASLSDVRAILPSEILEVESFDARAFSKATKLKGRKLSFALSFLCKTDLAEREKCGNKFIYRIKNN